MELEICFGFTIVALIILPPVLLCWTAAVVAARYLRDRPIGVRRTFDAMAAGFQVMLIAMILSVTFATIAGSVAVIPFLIYAEHRDVRTAGYIVVPSIMLLAIAVAHWQIVWPVAREEWRRLTKTDREFGPDAYEPRD